MRKTRVVCIGLAVVVLAWMMVAPAAAQPLDKRTYFTFSGTVTVPGVTLPAGEYVFRFADTGLSVVQVQSRDGKTTHALFLVHRAERAETPDDPEVRFMETAVGVPPAIQTWWYPGQRIGYEFVYPKSQARLLAKGTGRPVLTTVTETPATEPPKPDAELALITPAGEEIKVPEAAPMTPSGPVQVGEVAPEIPAQARATLPKTATAVPLVGFAGLAFLLMAGMIAGVRFARGGQK